MSTVLLPAIQLFNNADEITSAVEREGSILHFSVSREAAPVLIVEDTDRYTEPINAVTLLPREAKVLYEYLSRPDVQHVLGF